MGKDINFNFLIGFENFDIDIMIKIDYNFFYFTIMHMTQKALDKIIIKKLFNTLKGKNFHRRGLQENISEIKMCFHDHSIRFNPHDSIGARIYSLGVHTRKPIDDALILLNKKGFFKKTSNCIEFGSNIGTHTIYMHLQKLFKKIYAIEPDENNYNLLLQNLIDNKLLNKSEVLKFAISNISGAVKLFKDDNNSGAHTLLNKNKNKNYEIVQAITTKELFKNFKIKNIDFAFFDIEGMELVVIPDFIKEVNKNIPIFFEFAPTLYNKKEITNFCKFLDKTYNNFIFYQDTKKKFVKNELKNIHEILKLDFEHCDILAF